MAALDRLSDPVATEAGPRHVDATALARVQRRLRAASAPPWLHGEVARRMAQRLAVIVKQPKTVFDWDAFIGAGRTLLTQTYPRARVVAVERDEARRAATAAALAAPWWSPGRLVRGAPPVRLVGDVQAGQGELLWANMTLHRVPDPAREIAAWHRALAVDGFLMFSTLGPGSLQGLRALYRAQGWPSPYAPFVDMHDLGDMLVEAGFADPVMDQETLTLHWASPSALLAELRALGGNADPARTPGLRTPRWRGRLEQALQLLARDGGRIGLDFEIVYGHAFRPLPRPRVSRETAVPLEDLRTMARAGRRGPSSADDDDR